VAPGASGSTDERQICFTYGRTHAKIVYHADNGKREDGEFSTVRNKGIFYQYVRMHNPRKVIGAAEFESLLARYDSERPSGREALQHGLVSRPSWSFDPAIDPRGRGEFDAALEKYRDRIEEALIFNNEAEVSRLQEEEKNLRDWLASELLGKRAKNADPEVKRLRNRVSKDLEKGWKSIFGQMPLLGVHIRRFTVKHIGGWEYRPPESSVIWVR
jgi:hypothetical protein